MYQVINYILIKDLLITKVTPFDLTIEIEGGEQVYYLIINVSQ